MADTSRPRKVFEAGYEKSSRDLYDLTLEEQDFRPSSAKCVEISLGGALSNLDDSKPLIFVFVVLGRWPFYCSQISRPIPRAPSWGCSVESSTTYPARIACLQRFWYFRHPPQGLRAILYCLERKKERTNESAQILSTASRWKRLYM